MGRLVYHEDDYEAGRREVDHYINGSTWGKFNVALSDGDTAPRRVTRATSFNPTETALVHWLVAKSGRGTLAWYADLAGHDLRLGEDVRREQEKERKRQKAIRKQAREARSLHDIRAGEAKAREAKLRRDYPGSLIPRQTYCAWCGRTEREPGWEECWPEVVLLTASIPGVRAGAILCFDCFTLLKAEHPYP